MSRKRINILFSNSLPSPMSESKCALDTVIEELNLTPATMRESNLLDKIEFSMSAGFDVTFSAVDEGLMPVTGHDVTAIVTGVGSDQMIIQPVYRRPPHERETKRRVVTIELLQGIPDPVASIDNMLGGSIAQNPELFQSADIPETLAGKIETYMASGFDLKFQLSSDVYAPVDGSGMTALAGFSDPDFVPQKNLRIDIPKDETDPAGYVQKMLAKHKEETGEDALPEVLVEVPTGTANPDAYAVDYLRKCGVTSGIISMGASFNFSEDSVITLPNPMIAAVDQVNKVAGRKRTGGWAALKKQADMLMPEVDELLLAIENRDLAKARDAIADVVVIAFGHGSVAPIPIEEDFFRVTDALHSRFDSTKELGEESLEHHISRGIKAALYETVVDGTSYWVCRTTEACVDCAGEKYSIDKFLKSKFFHEPTFSPIDFDHEI